MKARMDMPTEAIGVFCKKWRIVEFAVFGSILRDDFRPDSDVDVMVVFEPDARWDFEHLLEMTNELKNIFGRKVDLVEKRFIEGSENYIRRRHILNHMESIYVAG